MSPLYLLLTPLLFIINVTKSQTIAPNLTTTTLPAQISTTAFFTTETGCSSNYAFVYIESSLQTLSETVLSERVNYPPYGYGTTIRNKKIVLYANAENISNTHNNPCNISTWNTPISYYDNTIVLLTYNEYYDTLCSPQQWTLNLENYANIKAVLIANNMPLTVYPLSGDTKLSNPTIPTRMITKDTAQQIVNTITNTTQLQDIFASIDCFNDTTHPTTICITDNNAEITQNFALDGEFQEQANIMINDHPIWKKNGHHGLLLVNDFYIWLTVNHSANNAQNPWRWVIGTNYLNDNSIDIECILNTTDYIDDPTLCGNHWYRDAREYNVSSHGGICNLGDTFICVDTPITSALVANGRYRQIHRNFPYWIHENGNKNVFLFITANLTYGPDGYAFVFGTGELSIDVIAVCPFQAWSTTLDTKLALSPWSCPVWAYDYPYLYVTPYFDVDQCAHANATNVTEYYPPILCMSDASNAASFYEGYHGVYLLDNATFDGRFVYKNQRLDGSWFFLHVDEYDAWTINEQVPNVAIPSKLFGLQDCDENDGAFTPDLCAKCWYFVNAFDTERQCNITVVTTNSYVESDCIPDVQRPINISYTQQIVACFDDANTNIFDSDFTGLWSLQSNMSFNDRAVWSMDGRYVYYSKRWKYWVIDAVIRDVLTPNWELICLLWREHEPWNCTTWYYKRTNNGYLLAPGVVTMRECTLAPTANPTVSPTYNCPARQIYINLESTLHSLSPRTASSSYVNFAPYYYTELLATNITLFEQYRSMKIDDANPCNVSTWRESTAYYDDQIVMLLYSAVAESWCSVQQWTLNLQSYANVVAVLIANDADAGYVYELSGDASLADPVIPTRMISQWDGWEIKTAEANPNTPEEEVIVEFGCFGDSAYPAMICLVDASLNGLHVHLDGDYQELGGVTKNDHPIWRKRGKVGLWSDIYMFLHVNVSAVGDDAWRWAIGTDYNDDTSIMAACGINGTHIEHPALCGANWFVNNALQTNLTTTNATCKLTDNYVCLTSSSLALDFFEFNGKYRQSHEGVALWLGEKSFFFDAYLAVDRVTIPQMNIHSLYAFVLVQNQTELYAFCVIDNGDEPTQERALSPWLCHDWYVLDFLAVWYVDAYFDVDQCDEYGKEAVENATYDTFLCFIDVDFTNGAYSHYQGLFGVYVLDNETIFDERPVYTQQRLLNHPDGDWHILYYDEGDAWVINDYIPSLRNGGAVVLYESICAQDVATPNNCSEYWQFYSGYEDIVENGSDAILFAQYSANENECVIQPMDTTVDYTESVSLCFEDGNGVFYENYLTGEYMLAAALYNERHYWYKNDTLGVFYLFYDTPKRFWVIDDTLGDAEVSYFTSPDFEVYCLLWDEYEPFNCDIWYYYSLKLNLSYTQTMYHINCVLPTASPTAAPIATTDSDEQGDDDLSDGGKKDNAWKIWLIVAGIVVCCGILCIFAYFSGRSEKYGNAKRDWGRNNSDDVMIQMGTTVNNTNDGFGETIHDHEVDDDDDEAESDEAIDGLDDFETGTKKAIDSKSTNWDKFGDDFIINDDDGTLALTGEENIFDVDNNGDGDGDDDDDDEDEAVVVAPVLNPFDDDDNMRGRLSTVVGGGVNPFLESFNADPEILPTSVEKRNNWIKFDE